MIQFAQIGIILSIVLLIISILKKVEIIPETLLMNLSTRTLMVGAFYVLLLIMAFMLLEIWKKMTSGKGEDNDSRYQGTSGTNKAEGDFDRSPEKAGREEERD